MESAPRILADISGLLDKHGVNYAVTGRYALRQIAQYKNTAHYPFSVGSGIADIDINVGSGAPHIGEIVREMGVPYRETENKIIIQGSDTVVTISHIPALEEYMKRAEKNAITIGEVRYYEKEAILAGKIARLRFYSEKGVHVYAFMSKGLESYVNSLISSFTDNGKNPIIREDMLSEALRLLKAVSGFGYEPGDSGYELVKLAKDVYDIIFITHYMTPDRGKTRDYLSLIPNSHVTL